MHSFSFSPPCGQTAGVASSPLVLCGTKNWENIPGIEFDPLRKDQEGIEDNLDASSVAVGVLSCQTGQRSIGGDADADLVVVGAPSRQAGQEAVEYDAVVGTPSSQVGNDGIEYGADYFVETDPFWQKEMHPASE